MARSQVTRPLLSLLALAGIAVLGGCSSQKSLGMLRAEADAALFVGDQTTALDRFEQIAARRPGDAEVRYQQGQALMALGREAEAREVLTMAYNLEPRNDVYRDALVTAMSSTAEHDELFALLERLATEKPTVENQIKIGQTAEKIGFADEAERAYIVAAKLAEPTDPRPHRALADFYRSIKNDEKELQRLRVVLGFDINDAAVRARIRELGEVPGPSFVLAPGALDRE